MGIAPMNYPRRLLTMLVESAKMLRKATEKDLGKQSCHCKTIERHRGRRTKKEEELTGACAAAMER
jgi:hypothetical protein